LIESYTRGAPSVPVTAVRSAFTANGKHVKAALRKARAIEFMVW